MKRIENLEVEQVPDFHPDLSYLGRYTHKPSAADYELDKVIDRGGHSFTRYFVATLSAKDTGNPDSVQQDFERMQSYSRGDWHMVGVRAKATLVVNGASMAVTSPGLWGIESDSSQEHFTEVGREELNQLRDTLLELGFTKRQFTAARKAAGL